MKKARIKNKKENKKIEETNNYSLKQMIFIVLIISLIFLIFYFITTIVVNKKEIVNDTNNIVEVDSSLITLNNLLNRKEDEYYVLATMDSLYKSLTNVDANYIDLYNNYLNDYQSKEENLPVYRVNLDDALNKKYISDEINISNNLNELKLNNEVLFKIKNGNIEKYYVGKEQIVDKLSRLKS